MDLREILRRKARFVPDPSEGDDVNRPGASNIHWGNPKEAPDTKTDAKPVLVKGKEPRCSARQGQSNIAQTRLEPLSGHGISCEFPGPYTSFKAINDDPRCHVEYKIRGRIVDITPSHPREMINLYCTRCEKVYAFAC